MQPKDGYKILFVCLGNICRSPMAKGLLQQKIDTDVHFVDAAGLDHYHLGEPPCDLTMEVCRKHGCIPRHRARLLRRSDLETFDRIYVMDHQNLEAVRRMATPEQMEKVDLVLNEVFPGENLDVPDPYMNPGIIDTVYQLLDAATTAIADKINRGEL
ncbi:MAG: low molecular weight phosphotyrosine protein phosphatase [Chlorobi bacterium]|nr:low molecular weight phosphotyrosine protein phosphatase [Chlorobiota bacterium]